MIRRVAAVAGLLIAAVVVQTALFPLLPTGWFRPDLAMLVVIAVGLHDGPFSGMRVGFAAGLLTDLLVALTPAGIVTLVHTVIGFAAGSARPYLSPASVTAPLAIAFGFGLLGTATVGTLAVLLGDERVSGVLLVQAAAAVAVYNVLLAPAVLPAVRALLERAPRSAMAE